MFLPAKKSDGSITDLNERFTQAMRVPRSMRVLLAVCIASTLAACAPPVPYRSSEGSADVDCSAVKARPDDACSKRTPEE